MSWRAERLRSPKPPTRKIVDPAQLEEELHEAVELAVHGQPWRPTLVGSMKLAALTVLQRHGLANAQVHAALLPEGGFELRVQLPPSAPRVQQILIRYDMTRR